MCAGRLQSLYPDLRTFFSSGSMVDAILNMGAPAPIDVQVSSRDLDTTYNAAEALAAQIRKLQGIGEVYIPQDMNYPAIRLNVDRVHASELGLTQKEIVDNVITALNSNTMIAPNYWVDHQTGNDYFLTVQYYEHGQPAIHNFVDLTQIPLRQRASNSRLASAGSQVPDGRWRAARHDFGECLQRRIRAVAHGNRSLPDSARSGRVCHSVRRGPG